LDAIIETRTLPEVLAQEGIADLTGLWPVEQVESWNQRLDSLFAAIEDQPRAVLGPDQLVDVGIFHEMFSEPARRLIASVHPSALLYHCHCYETAGGQSKSHINEERLDGWHRDYDALKDFAKNFPNFISIFILLSPVGDDDGAFEFAPNSADRIRAGSDIVQLVGPVGTAAIWSRCYYHRAAPNRGPRRRRILKISFQPAGLANELIGTDEFKAAWSKLDDPVLKALVDERRVGTSEPLADSSDPVEARLMPPTSRNGLSGPAVAKERLHMASRKLLSLTGSSS
jgi:Phytanoyl-CoA dioxygenase (PhyH)